MPRYEATRELLARQEDVWSFLAEPRHLSDWWPGIAAVEPDRRGLAPGARWRIRTPNRPTLVRKPNVQGVLLILDVQPHRSISWRFVAENLDVELALEPVGHDHTRVHLAVEGAWLVGLRRDLPRRALRRLYDLVQTAAEL